MKDHLDWVDKNNDGCSHIGIHPDLLPRDIIRFDTFHLKCAITRKVMKHVRDLILNQSNETIAFFSKKVLKLFWNDYHLYVWNNRKNFSSFVGNELALFVGNIPTINEFLDTHVVPTSKVLDTIEGLSL